MKEQIIIMANKYNYLIIGQGHYDQGWEDETTYPDNRDGWKEAKMDRRAYRGNSPYPFRLIRRRELKEATKWHALKT